MTDFQAEAETLYDDLGEPDDHTVESLALELEAFVTRDIPLQAAISNLRGKYNSNSSSGDGRDQLSKVADITSEDQWADMKVKISRLWDSDSDAIAQSGLFADETGSIPFVQFSNTDVDMPMFEEGESYYLKSLVSNEQLEQYGGGYQMKINKHTTLDEDFDETVSDTQTVVGPVVDLQKGSGLIKRCPEPDCTQVLNDGRCYDHGDVEDGEYDLRIKAILDSGVGETKTVIIDSDLTTELTGLTLEAATKMAREEMSSEVVAEEIRDTIVGRYFEFTISHYSDDMWNGESVTRIETGVSNDQATELVDAVADALEVEA